VTRRKITDDGRELAAFVGGRWTGAWYWRDHVEHLRANPDHAGRSFLDYRPTERWIENPTYTYLQGRVWEPINPRRHTGSQVSVYRCPDDELIDGGASRRA
jgi:hypothetical protein